MEEVALQQIPAAVRSAQLHSYDPLATLGRLAFAELAWAKVAHHRAFRQGLPEAVYGPSEAPEQAASRARGSGERQRLRGRLRRPTDAQVTKPRRQAPRAALAGGPAGGPPPPGRVAERR